MVHFLQYYYCSFASTSTLLKHQLQICCSVLTPWHTLGVHLQGLLTDSCMPALHCTKTHPGSRHGMLHIWQLILQLQALV